MVLKKPSFDNSRENYSRREAISILSTGSVITAAGCVGGGDEGGSDTATNETSNQIDSSGDEDSDNDEQGNGADGGSPSLPDYVIEADEIYQSVEIDLEEGILYLTHNEDGFGNGEEPADLYIEEISDYGLIEDGTTRAYNEIVELTILDWPNTGLGSEHFGLGEVEITTRDDNREGLGSIIIDCTPQFEVTSVAILEDKLDEEEIDEDSIPGEDIFIEFKNPGGAPPAPVNSINLWIDEERSSPLVDQPLISADPGGPDSLLKEPSGIGEIVVLAEGTNKTYTEGGLLEFSTAAQLECGGSEFEGTLEFKHLLMTDDELTTEVPVTVTRKGESEDYHCPEFDIELQ